MRTAYFILQYCPLIPILYGVFHFPKLLLPLKIFFFMQLVSLLFTIVMTVLAKQGINNLWLMNTTMPIYTVLVMWMFSFWETRQVIQNIFKITAILFCILWATELIVNGSFFQFTKYSRPLMNILFIGVSCLAVYEDNKNEEVLLVEQPRFWISSGLIIYYSGTLVVNLLANTLLRISEDVLRDALYLQSVLNLFTSILYVQGLRIQCRR